MRLDRGRDDDEGGWLDARLSFLRNIGWGARDAVAFTVGAVGSVAILVNALFLQSGPHPAPLFKAPLSPVATGEATNTVVVAVPRARPAEPVPVKVARPAVPRPPARIATPSPATPAAGPGRNDANGGLPFPSRRAITLPRALV